MSNYKDGYRKEGTTGRPMRFRVSLGEVRREVLPDPDPDTSYLEMIGFEDRQAAFRRGEFHYVGVRASCMVTLRSQWEPHYTIEHVVESPGIWGIESDMGDAYIDEVFEEEAGILREMLAAMGLEASADVEAARV